jgi:16S rRNA (adenine1518-N6/adenine1519-N6)-dimethyltransferase
VHLVRKKPAEIPEINTKQFFRIIKAGFSSRRKTLHNSLSGGLHIDKKTIKEILETAGISASQRPQELSLEDWFRLCKQLP